MGRELDRSKGAGKNHDAERDLGHYVDLGDNGEVMGVVPLAKLPATREAYDTELRANGFTQYKAGYLLTPSSMAGSRLGGSSPTGGRSPRQSRRRRHPRREPGSRP